MIRALHARLAHLPGCMEDKIIRLLGRYHLKVFVDLRDAQTTRRHPRDPQKRILVTGPWTITKHGIWYD